MDRVCPNTTTSESFSGDARQGSRAKITRNSSMCCDNDKFTMGHVKYVAYLKIGAGIRKE